MEDRRWEELELHSPRLALRVLGPGFAAIVADYFARNRAWAQPWNPISPEEFYTAAFQAARLEHDLRLTAEGQMARFWLFRREDAALERVIGHVALSNIVRGALQGCFVGYMIDGGELNQGLMTEAVRRVAEFAFGELKLHRLEANIMPHNAASLRVAEKCGFAREGLSPRYLKINGQWQDHYRYALLNPAEE